MDRKVNYNQDLGVIIKPLRLTEVKPEPCCDLYHLGKKSQKEKSRR